MEIAGIARRLVRPAHLRSLRPAHVGLVAVAVLMAFLADPLRAQSIDGSTWSYDHDLGLTYEIDDNVAERIDDPVRAQVARLAYRGDLLWGAAGEQRLSLNYQGGMKRHFGFGDSVTNQFVNEGTLGYQRRVSDMVALGGTIGLKNRAWTDGFFFINEDGFTRVSGTVSGLVNLTPLSEGETPRLELGARYSDTDFENLDRQFGNHLMGAYASIAKDFGTDLSVRWDYSFDRIRFPGRGKLEPGDSPQSINGPTRDRQEDHVHELGTVVTWLGPISVQGEYSFRLTDSNSFGFSYLSHNVGLQVLRRLPWGMLVQLYGQIELRDFSEPVANTPTGSLDTGETENNVLLLRLVKDVTPDYSLEVRYGRYRNEAITLNDFYTKNIYAVGMNYRP
ncbi:MAG TPA: hypothetical protein VFH11_10815 [Gemmatimonadota bacterium]|nr:hypothetical protein [Gemmatimonadota bacterium]